MIQISEPPVTSPPRLALFNLGFRPFFLLAGLSAVLLLAYWVTSLSQGVHAVSIAPVNWHSHEMIFGYSAAVIAGFLLTAVRNWTDVQTLNGKPLMLLAIIWLVARILPFTSLPPGWFSIIDMLFLPLFALAIASPIVKVKQWKNMLFVPLILLFAVANGFFHAELVYGVSDGMQVGILGGLGVIIMIITVMAGRVVGFFIERGLGEKITSYEWAEWLSLRGTLLLMAGLFIFSGSVLSAIAIFAAIGHIGRLVGWYNKQLWTVPLLWVLYLGYCWLAAGFVLSALALHGIIDRSLAIHTFTVGAIGIMTIGMMARVALGHSGREMKTTRWMNGAFVLINLAVVVRVVMPLLAPGNYMLWVELSAALWILAFLIFTLIYLPVLTLPRIDGRPG